MDNVLSDAPYRQRLLSLPIPLRFWMATNKKLTSKVHQNTSQEISAYYTSVARSKGTQNPLPGSITFIQRFGSACNLNTHFHLEEEVLRPDLDQLFHDHPGMTQAMAASIQSKIAFSKRAGQKLRRVGFGYEEKTPLVKGTQYATINGFNLHAKLGVAAHTRDRLLQLIKYVSRPLISNERLSRQENGDLLYELKTPWSDATTSILQTYWLLPRGGPERKKVKNHR